MKATVEANFNADGWLMDTAIFIMSAPCRYPRSGCDGEAERKELSRLADVVADIHLRPDLGASTFGHQHDALFNGRLSYAISIRLRYSHGKRANGVKHGNGNGNIGWRLLLVSGSGVSGTGRGATCRIRLYRWPCAKPHLRTGLRRPYRSCRGGAPDVR